MICMLGILGCGWIAVIGASIIVTAISSGVSYALNSSAESDKEAADKETKAMYTEANDKAENKKRAMAKYQQYKNDKDWKAFRTKMGSAKRKEMIYAERVGREAAKLKKESKIDSKGTARLNSGRLRGNPISS